MTIARREMLFGSAGAAAIIAIAATGAPVRVWAQGDAQGAGEAAVPKSDLVNPKYGSWGFDATGLDRTIKPGDDFFGYANGKWDERTVIPTDLTRFGSFDILGNLSENRAHAIDIDAAAGRLQDADGAKIGAAYASFMNAALVEKLGADPIRPQLAEIRSIGTRAQFTGLMAKAPTSGFATIFPLHIADDDKNPMAYAVYVSVGGLGLPDRDFYLKPDFAGQRAKYAAYVEHLLTLVGWSSPGEQTSAILQFETQLAEATWTRTQNREKDKTYNPATPAELAKLAPGIDWPQYLAASDLAAARRVIVTTDTAFPKVAKIFAETPLETLKAWQAFHLADGAAPYLSKDFSDAYFEFHGRALAGQAENQPRWKRAVAFTNSAIGESVGRVYVARYFPPESKAKIDELVSDILTALHARIEKLDWMGEATRARALEKLSKISVKIGYPNKWRDYSSLVLEPIDLYGNVLRAKTFDWRRQAARINSPLDRSEWNALPQTVNASYIDAKNEITFPAAILAPPFFDPNADPAINYGGIGGVIGHEISHGFDDQGRKSDGEGRLRDWWEPEDNAKFKIQAERLGAQYSEFEPFPGVHVQGQLTMGENIGDMGGLSLALDAYHASLRGRPAPVIDGFTGDQRVFLGWAQIWRIKIRDQALRQRLSTDEHSPARYRVIGTIRNVDGWYKAFNVQPGDKLYVPPEQRVKIW